MDGENAAEQLGHATAKLLNILDAEAEAQGRPLSADARATAKTVRSLIYHNSAMVGRHVGNALLDHCEDVVAFLDGAGSEFVLSRKSVYEGRAQGSDSHAAAAAALIVAVAECVPGLGEARLAEARELLDGMLGHAANLV